MPLDMFYSSRYSTKRCYTMNMLCTCGKKLSNICENVHLLVKLQVLLILNSFESIFQGL